MTATDNHTGDQPMNRKQRRAAAKGRAKGPPPPGIPATPSSGVAALLQQAVGHHQAGRLTEAGAIYRDILDLDAKNYHALYFLGVIATQTGQQPQAVDFLTRAIQLNPKVADAHSNLGIVLKQQGKFDDAIADPEGVSDLYFSEDLIRLPHGFHCYKPPMACPEVAPLPAPSPSARSTP